MSSELEGLSEVISDMGIFYNALRDFLLGLEALENKDVEELFKKYKVEVR